MANKNRIKSAIVIISALVLLVFAGIIVYYYTAGNNNVSGLVYYPAAQPVVTQTIVQTTTQNTQQQYYVPEAPQAAKPAAPVAECNTWMELEDNCKASNGCSGVIKKNCVNGKWTYSNCTTAYSMCSNGECKLDCRDTKQKYMDTYGINNKTLIFYYINDDKGGYMLPFMEKMENVMQLYPGKDVWLESYMGLRDTPTVMCFGNQAFISGRRTEQEVKDFRKNLCSQN